MTQFLSPNGEMRLPQARLPTMDQGQHWRDATSVSHTSRAEGNHQGLMGGEGREGEGREWVCVLLLSSCDLI